AMTCRRRHCVVIVVPTFAQGENSYPPDIQTVVARVVQLITPTAHVAEGVDELRAPENDNRREYVHQAGTESEHREYDSAYGNVDTEAQHRLARIVTVAEPTKDRIFHQIASLSVQLIVALEPLHVHHPAIERVFKTI